MKAVILSGSYREKMFPFSKTRPNSMLFVGGKYVIEVILEQLKKIGIYEIIIVIGHNQSIIQEYFHYGQKIGLDISYIEQENQDGIGNAIMLTKTHILPDEKFLLLYSDILSTDEHFLQFKEDILTAGQNNIAAVAHPIYSGNYGNIYLNNRMQITKFIESPQDTKIYNYIFAGVFLFQRNIFDILSKNEENMEKTLQEIVKSQKMYACLWESNWIDISYPWHILTANKIMMDNWKHSIIPASVKIGNNVNIRGIVHFGENITIEAGTSIVGPCHIGSGCYIGHSSLIRSYTCIGDNCTIGYGTEIKGSVLFGSSIIGRLAFIGDSVIGEGAEFGSGCMTINYDKKQNKIHFLGKGTNIKTSFDRLGTFIGDNAFIGANNSLAPGTVIEDDVYIADNITIKKNQYKTK